MSTNTKHSGGQSLLLKLRRYHYRYLRKKSEVTATTASKKVVSNFALQTITTFVKKSFDDFFLSGRLKSSDFMKVLTLGWKVFKFDIITCFFRGRLKSSKVFRTRMSSKFLKNRHFSSFINTKIVVSNE